MTSTQITIPNEKLQKSSNLNKIPNINLLFSQKEVSSRNISLEPHIQINSPIKNSNDIQKLIPINLDIETDEHPCESTNNKTSPTNKFFNNDAVSANDFIHGKSNRNLQVPYRSEQNNTNLVSEKFESLQKNLMKEIEEISQEKIKLDQPTKQDSFSNIMMNHLNSNEIISEIFYRYNHEANKIIFWLKTVKFIMRYLIEVKISKSIFIFATFILIKSIIRCKFLIYNLKMKTNKYNQIKFEEFVESDKYEQSIKNFEDLLHQAKSIKKFFKTSSKFSFYLHKFKLESIIQGKIYEKEFSSILTSQLIGIIKEKVINASESVSLDLMKIIVFSYFSKESHSLFPYWNTNRKFKWDYLDIKFQNISFKNLQEIILKIYEVLNSSHLC